VAWQETESFVIYTAAGPPLPKATSDLISRYERDLPGSIHGDGWLYVVFVNGECQHFGQVGFSSRQTRILGEPSQTPLIGPCVTVPEARGRGLYRRALAELGVLLQAAGHKRIIIETSPENYASQRGIEAAGYELQRIMNIWIFFNVLAVATIRINDSVSRKIWCVLNFRHDSP
jgi:RimJ/RimL family protein N-acetyltransferase